jgi:hypothetical protein
MIARRKEPLGELRTGLRRITGYADPVIWNAEKDK